MLACLLFHGLHVDGVVLVIHVRLVYCKPKKDHEFCFQKDPEPLKLMTSGVSQGIQYGYRRRDALPCFVLYLKT